MITNTVTSNILILITIILVLIILYNDTVSHKLYVYYNDIKLLCNMYRHNMHYKINQQYELNNFKTMLNDRCKIVIISFDNRDLEYIRMHNDNFNKYCKKWNIEYQFISTCKYNVYWCKIYMLLDALNTGKYDYVMWSDTDVIIKRDDINLRNIIYNYNNDIIIGDDNSHDKTIVNSGIFIIKNSVNGINFLKDCISMFESRKDICMQDAKVSHSLNGIWALSCYEQGIMNDLILHKYFNNTSMVHTNIFYNYYTCNDNVFMMHLYSSSDEARVKCFKN